MWSWIGQEWMHAAIFVALFGAVAGQAFRLKRWWAAALAGVGLHALFDLLTPAHLSLLERWDPWALGLLALTAAWPVLAWLVMAEIGSKSTAGVGLARFTLGALLLYGGARALLHERALETMKARIYEAGTPKSYAALPHGGNPLAWTGVIEFEGASMVVEIDLRKEFDPTAGKTYYKPVN